jgi:dynein heavy chain, axonemal
LDFEDRIEMLLLDKLLLMRALREDRTPLGVKEYVMDALGKRYADSRGARHSPPGRRTSSSQPSSSRRRARIRRMRSTSSARKMKKKVGSIPMDQGQEPAARKLLQQGMLVGSWVLLQNCHLGLKMMRELETTIIQKRATEPEDLHDE